MANTIGTLPAKQDANQVYTSLGISGTLGATYGTAEPRPITVTDDGKLRTETSVTLNSGTINTLGTIGTIQSGTIARLEQGSINVTAGTVVVTSGTQQTLGTVGTVQRLAGGTINFITEVESVGGMETLAYLGTVGTITRLEGGTLGILSQGSINVTAGTVGGKAASGAAAVANPVLTAGTDAGGTVYAPLMTTTGHQLIDVLTGTIQSSGTTTGVGVVTSVTEVVNLAKGTITKLEQGSIQVTAGTIASVGTVPGVGVVTSVTNLVGGTLGILTNGTLSSSGTTTGVGVVTSVTDVANLAKGTITRLEGGTLGILSQGSINVTAGTVGGKDASGAAAVANPVLVAGTDAGGTVYSLLVDNTGALQITSNQGDLTGGTIDLLTAGTITRLEQGSINVTAGTIGTVVGVGVVTSVTNLASGTLLNSGTTTGVGVVSALTTGTVGGKAASGAAAVANPVLVAGTDAGGTVYSLLVDNTGALQITANQGDLTGGTIDLLSAGTINTVNSATVDLLKAGTITKLEQGSINVTAGTMIVTVGTVGGKAASGAAAVANPILIAGTDAGGTIYSPLVTTTGHLLTDILSGTIQSSGTVTGVGVVTSVTNLAGGTIGILTNGTLSSSGTTTGVGVVTTVTSVTEVANLAKGTITKLEGGTLGILAQGSINVTAGTFRDDARTSRNILTYGTTFGGGAAAYGTLVGSASVGAGTYTWVDSISITNPSGNITTMVGFGTALNGTSVLWKGTLGTTSSAGVVKSFPHAVNAGMTNQDLVCYISGAGTVDVNVTYFISA